LFNNYAYRDKKVDGFVRFRAPLQQLILETVPPRVDWPGVTQ
jgi:hypothetical protein